MQHSPDPEIPEQSIHCNSKQMKLQNKMLELCLELIFCRPFLLLFIMFYISFVSGNTKSYMKEDVPSMIIKSVFCIQVHAEKFH